MSLPRHDVKNARPRSLFTTVSITILILAGLYFLVQSLMNFNSDPDRPPIIISSGSVRVESGGDWVDEGQKGFKQDFDGKSVKSFLAITGPLGTGCAIQGKTIVVTYGSSEITFSRKGKFLAADSAFAQFPAGANVSANGAGKLVVTTDDGLVSFRDDKGDSCNVTGGTLAIYQLH